MYHFFDTNILVYLFDEASADQKLIAQKLVADEVQARRFCISAQVLQELYVVLVNKLALPLPRHEAEGVIRDFANLTTVQVEIETILKAIQLQQRINYSFWDSLIVQSALSAGAVRLYSEDMQHQQQIQGVQIINPFIKASENNKF